MHPNEHGQQSSDGSLNPDTQQYGDGGDTKIPVDIQPQSHRVGQMGYLRQGPSRWVMGIQLIIVLAATWCYLLIWFGDLPFAFALIKDGGHILQIPANKWSVWFMNDVSVENARPKFAGWEFKFSEGKADRQNYRDIFRGKEGDSWLTTISLMQGIMKWGTMVPMILLCVGSAFFALRLVSQSRQEGFRKVGRILVSVANFAPFFVIIEIVQIFTSNGHYFIADGPDEGDGLQWDFGIAWILTLIATGFMVLLEISECF